MLEQEKFCTLEPFYLDGAAGRLFSVLYKPLRPINAKSNAVIFFPPFTEELNKSRRMIALQARRFAQIGLATLVVDLYGTGDSEGQLQQASWSLWRDDMQLALNWLSQQGYQRPVYWGLRLGCTLAIELARAQQEGPGVLLLWQPVANSQVYLNQFLRLKLAAELFGDSQQKNLTTKDIRQQLKAGQSVEIAGYELSPALADDIEQSNIQELSGIDGLKVLWFDVVSGEQGMTIVNKKLAEKWLAQQVDVQTTIVSGEQFWTTPEIAVVPGLLDKTAEAIQREVCK